MFAALGNKVVALHRWRIGNVELDESLEEGEFRPSQEEIDKFSQNMSQNIKPTFILSPRSASSRCYRLGVDMYIPSF